MTVTRDQQSSTLSVSSGTSGTVSWSVNPTAGSTVLLFIQCAGTITGVTDNGSSPTAFTLDKSTTGGRGAYIYRANGISLPSSGAYHVTITTSSATTIDAGGWSYLGMKAGAPDATNSGTGTGTAVSSGSAGPAAAGGVVFGGFSDASGLGSESVSFTGASPLTQQFVVTNGVSFWPCASADGLTGSAQIMAWTLGDSVAWGAVIAAYSPASSGGGTNPSWDPTGAWTLTFDDEFAGTTLPAHWQPGWFGASGITPPVNSGSPSNNSANVSVSGGFLNLTLGPVGGTVYGALVTTNPGNSGTATGFTQGPPAAFEAKINVPGPDGSILVPNWVAWWTDGTGTWPSTGEVDILESLGTPDWNAAHVHDNTTDGSGGTGAPGITHNLSPPYGWHTFGCYRTATSVEFFYDGVSIGSLAIDTTAAHYLILVNTYNGSADTTPTTMQVDWVRVWTPGGGGTTPSGSDTVHGTEAGSVRAALAKADTAHGADTGLPVHAALAKADTAHGLEAGNAGGSTSPRGSDTAHGTEAGSVRATLTKADTAHGTEAGSVAVLTRVSSSDTGHGTESGLVHLPGTGGVLGVKLGEQVGHGSVPPGLPGGAGGPAGPPAPYPGTGWEVKVLAAPDFHTLLAVIPAKVLLTQQFAIQLKDLGSGTVTLDMDDTFWTTVTLPNGQPAHYLLDWEHVWQVWQDGVCRFEFLGETVTETLADQSEQRIATVTGPGTAATLKWAMCAPPGFPGAIRYKLDAITDGFSETDVSGNLVLDTGLWNAAAPLSRLSLNPSGTCRIMGSPGTTFLGTTVYDATNTLVSAQVNPIVSPDPAGASLNGSQLTQMYVQSLANPAYYALFGMSATTFYAQLGGPSGVFTHTIASATAFAAAQAGNQDYQYWQIQESGGQGGGSGTFTFYTSSDGQNWKQQYSIRHNWDATNCGLYFTAKYSTDNAEFATVTGINSNVTTSSLNGPSYYTQPIIGGVWLDLLKQAKARGTVPFIATGRLSSSTDSFGNPWSDSQSVQIANGTDLFTLLGAHTAMINADWIMQPGFLLQVGIPETGKVTLGTDRSSTIVFRDGMDCAARVRTRSRQDVSNLLGVINSDGRTITATDGPSVAEYGQREAWLQAAMQVTPADLEAVATAADLQNANEVLSWTVQVAAYQPGRTVFKDFGAGDWIGLERPDFSAIDVVRVVAIAVQVNADGSETHELTLNSYIQWLQEQLNYIQTKLGGGFINAAGTTAIASSITSSNSPTVFSLTLGSLGDVTSGGPGGNAPLVYDPVTGQWVPAGSDNTITGNVPLAIGGTGGVVTIGGDGGSVTVSSPPVPPADGGAPVTPPANTVIGITTTTITDATGTTRQIIGAQPDGTITSKDVNAPAPAAPDTPSVAAGPQSLVIGWDGLLGGSAPLSDFLWTEVHISASSGFIPSSSTLEGTMAAGGHSIVVGNLTPGTTYYVKLMARNTSGVAGSASVQASGVPGNVGSGVSVTFQATAPPSPSVGDLWGDTANGNEIKQWNGTSWVLYQWGTQAVSFTARGIGANTVTIASTAPSSPITGDLWYDGTNGFKLNQWSGSAWTPFQYGTNAIAAGSVTAALIAAGTITATQIAAGTITGANIAAATIAASNIVAGTITAAQIAAGTITATQIAAGTITGANIAATTITAANIAAGTITASQIAAGTITASLLSASIVVAGIVNGTTIQAALFLATGSTGQVLAYSGTPASGNLINAIAGATGTDSFGNTWPSGFMGKQLTLVDWPSGSTPATFSGASILYTSSQGKLRYIASNGNDLVLDRSVLDGTNFTMGTQTIPHILSSTLSYLAGEGLAASEYELEIDGTCTTPSTNAVPFTFDLFVDGAALSVSTKQGVGSVVLQAGNTYNFTVRYRLTIDTTGPSGTCTIAMDGACILRGANAGGNANSFTPMTNIDTALTFNSTTAHSLAIYCNWGSTTGTGHSAIVYRTKKTRRN